MTQTKSHSKVELAATSQLRNPETNATSRTFRLSGKVDRIEGSRLIDWKTTVDPMQYIQQKTIGYQLELYVLMLIDNDIFIDEVEYRLIRKPTIRLKKTESGEEYQQRCYEWLTADPRNMITETKFIEESRLKEAQKYSWEVSQRILSDRRNGFLRNENCCWRWNRACDYLPLCDADARGINPNGIIAESFEERRYRDDMTADTLSYSSMSCYCDCPAKYRWQYEKGLRPISDEIDARYIGNLVHLGLEVLAEHGQEKAVEAIIAETKKAEDDADWDKIEQESRKAMAIVQAAKERWNL